MGANDTLEQLRAAQAYAVELEAKNETLRLQVEQLQGELPPCDGGCNYNSGPEETCSAHGRPVAEVWDIAHSFALERDEAQARLAAVDVHEVELLRGERDALAAVIAEALPYFERNRVDGGSRRGLHILSSARTGDILRDRDATKWEQGVSDALGKPWLDVPSRESGFHRYGEKYIGGKSNG